MKRSVPLVLLLSCSAGAAPQTFVKLYSDGAEIMQWTELNGQLSGSYQFVYTDSNFMKLNSLNAAFTGTRGGNTFSFRFSQSLLGSTTTTVWTGVLTGQTLTVNRSQQTGMAQIAFTRGSVETYNKAITQLTGEVQRQQQLAQQAAQARAEQQVRVEAQTKTVRNLNREAAEAVYHANNLIDALQSDLKSLQSNAAMFGRDLAELAKDQQQLLSKAKEAEDCYDVRSVQGYDLSQLTGYDLSQLTGYDSAELKRTQGSVERHVEEAGQRRAELLAVGRSFSQQQARVPLSTQRWTVDLKVLAQTEQQLSSTLAQVQAELKKTGQVQQDALARATALIAEAQSVADGLTCPP